MSTPKPRNRDVEAVARDMEQGGDYRSTAWSVAERIIPLDEDFAVMRVCQYALIDAAIRLLLRRRDRVIRAIVTEAECGWMERGQDAVERINDSPVTPSELRLNEILNIKAEYDAERRGRGRK